MSTAVPPITPPTIAPTGVDFFGVGVEVAGLEGVDVKVVGEGVGGEGVGVELDEGVGVVDTEICLIVMLINVKDAADPPSVAVAYIVAMDGIESQ
jgi:hypothetical protein